jgi:ribosome-associated translation inhibitor RaiA
MVELTSGNVLLKPAQKKRVLTHLKRCGQLADLIGDCRVKVELTRSGRYVEARGGIAWHGVQTTLRSRDTDWRTAVDRLIHAMHQTLHAGRTQMTYH